MIYYILSGFVIVLISFVLFFKRKKKVFKAAKELAEQYFKKDVVRKQSIKRYSKRLMITGYRQRKANRFPWTQRKGNA